MKLHDQVLPAVVYLTLLPFLVQAAQREVHIQPTNPSTCTSTNPTCLTFVEVVRNRTLASDVFKSNTTLVFLPGNHEVDLEEEELVLTVENLENLIFEGRGEFEAGFLEKPVPTTKITCLSPLGLAFLNVSSLSFVNLTISGCGANLTLELKYEALVVQTHGIHLIGTEQKAALLVVNVLDFTTDFFSIENSKGYGLFAVNTLGDTVIDNSVFYSNNVYTRFEKRCYSANEDDVIACNGGNVLFVYEDLLACPKTPLQYTLTIRDTIFALGANINGGTLSDLTLTRGTGLGLILSQSSYSVTIDLQGIVSYGNEAVVGANLYFIFYESVENSTVRVRDTLSSTGNLYFLIENDSFGVSSAISGGLHFDYGTPIPTASPQPVCQRNTPQVPPVILDVSNCTFHNNSAITGAAMYIRVSPLSSNTDTFRFSISDTTFSQNLGLTGAGLFVTEIPAFGRQGQTEVLLDEVSFTTNGFILQTKDTARLDGLVFSAVTASMVANLTISNCSFHSNQGTAVDAFNTNLFMLGTLSFRSNTAVDGGALRFENAYMYLKEGTQVDFVENTARRLGGAIKVVSREDLLEPCFFQALGSQDIETANISLYFEDNYAESAGSVLYGGSIDRCYVVSNTPDNSSVVFNTIVDIGSHRNDTSIISSAPSSLCLCDNGTFFCELDAVAEISIFPGESFYVTVIAKGQRNGILPASVYAFSEGSQISQQEQIQQVGKECSNLTYTSLTKSDFISLSTGEYNTLSTVEIIVTALDCPLGFVLDEGEGCVCDPTPQIPRYNLECNLNERTVHRDGGTWVNASFVDLELRPVVSGVIIHFNCPFSKCLPEGSEVNLADPDSQCAFNRTGILCGACKPGLSLTVTSSKCVKCTNNTIVLLLLYLFGGIGLVVVLFTLKLLISEGTLGGIIFYANMVKVNESIFYPQNAFNSLTIFVSWLNLDAGVEACFYDGMDAYARSWLSYGFPLYVWFIVGVIYVASRYSLRISKLCGSTTVSVLSTLFLLSYNKLLLDVYLSLAFTVIVYPDDDFSAVWSLDGTIHYLHGRHIALFLFGNTILIFFLIPYTLILVFVPLPCIQAHTNRRFLRWINKLKPFLDAHYSPYKDRYRNWTGVLLLVRIVYTLIVSINIFNDTALPLLVLSIITSLLLAIAWIGGGVYKKWPINILEGSFYLNLSLLSASVFYILKTKGNLEVATYTSVSVALLEFIVIVFYHIYKFLCKFERVKRLKNKLRFRRREHELKETEKSEAKQTLSDLEGSSMVTIQSPTMTFADVSLREPLLDD